GQQFRGGLLRREDDVALVLPVLVVHHDDGTAGRDVGDGPLDVVQRDPGGVPADRGAGGRAGARAGVQLLAGGHRAPPSSFSTYLAMTSTSRLTSSPGWRKPSVVRLSVSGMRLTSNQVALSAETVRLTPSTATEPL